MQKWRKYLLLFLIIVSLCVTTVGQETWNLQQCIEYAAKNNIQIKKSALNIDISEQSLKMNKGQMLPNFNGFASHTYNFGQRIDPFTNQFANQRVRSNNFYLNSQLTIFNGFKTLNQIDQSKTNIEISKQNTQKMINDISMNIAGAYLQVLFAEEQLKISRNQLLVTQKQVDRITSLVEAGAAPKGELYNITAQLTNEELNVVNAENQVNLSYLNLQQLLQLDSIQDFRIAIPNIDLEFNENVVTTSGQIFDAALRVMPEIKSAELAIESNIKSIDIAKGNNYPTLSLSASYGTGYSGASKLYQNPTPFSYESGYTASGEKVYSTDYTFETVTKPFGDQFTDNLNQSIGLNLNIPIFNRWSASTNIEQSKIRVRQAMLDLEQTKNTLKQNIEQAHANSIAAYKKYLATKKTKESLQEAFFYAKERYEVGMINSVDFNDAKNKLTQAESNLLQAKYDYIYKTKILDFYQGKSLAF